MMGPQGMAAAQLVLVLCLAGVAQQTAETLGRCATCRGSPLQSPGPQAHSTQSAHRQLVTAVGPPGKRAHLQKGAAGSAVQLACARCVAAAKGCQGKAPTYRGCTVS